MALIKKPGCNNWIFQVSINGKAWARSTGVSERKLAEAKVPKLLKLAALHRQRPESSLRLKNAIVKEVARVEVEVSRSEAKRVDSCLTNFFLFMGDVPLEKVTDDCLKEYMWTRLQKKISKSTVQRELCSITRMLRENGYAVSKPMVRKGTKTKHRPFTDDELRKFFAQCNEAQRVLFLLMLATGARPAELVLSERSTHKPLLKMELDAKRNAILLRNAKLKAGQEEKQRRIQIPKGLMKEIQHYIRTVSGPYVFPGRNSSLKNCFDRILKRAGIEKIDPLGRKLTAHSFRHTYCTRMAQLVGNNPFILKEMMGHAQITTTQIYCQPTIPTLTLKLPVLPAQTTDKSSKTVQSKSQGRGKRSWKKKSPPVAEAG